MLLKKNNGSTMKSKNKWENTTSNWKRNHSSTKSMGCSKNSFKKEGHNDVSLPQETRKIPNVTYLPKQLEKRKKKKRRKKDQI